jgi:hypothetical protein
LSQHTSLKYRTVGDSSIFLFLLSFSKIGAQFLTHSFALKIDNIFLQRGV